MKEDSEQLQEWDSEQLREWLRQNNLIYGGLIGIGVVMVQPFLAAESLDLPARICVVAFSVAIPLLAALVLVNWQERFRGRATDSVLVTIARVVAFNCAFVGVVAGFWHIMWIAGVGMLVSGIVGVGVHSAGYWRLERDQEPGRSVAKRTTNKAIMRLYFEEAWNNRNLDILDEIIAPDLLDHEIDGSEQRSSPADVKRYLSDYHRAVPDAHMTVEDQVAEGDKVTTRYTMGGTHQGELMGVAATGKRIEVSGINVHRIEGGKIVEGWGIWDRLGMLRQLGAFPPPRQG